MDKVLNIFEAAILLKMSPNLLSWFTSYSPKFKETRKLGYVDCKAEILYFTRLELLDFDKYLSMPWPAEKEEQRPRVPSGIEDEIKSESKFRCVICNHASAHVAHIDPVHNSKNNHPHNLIYICPNCHDLYDKKKTIKRSQIKKLKDDLLQTKIIIWKSYTSLIDSVSSLIKELEKVSSKDFENKELQQDTVSELLYEIKKHVSKEFDTHPSEIKEYGKQKIFTEYKKKISEILIEDVDVEERLIKERNSYILESGKAECPLCKGTGVHNEWECPVCRGVGTVDQEAIDEIDLTPFEQEECPLCKGTGVHNEWECPVCRGVGTVDQEAIDEIDLTHFEQEECPLCKGTGIDNERECRGCRGIGTTDRRNLE